MYVEIIEEYDDTQKGDRIPIGTTFEVDEKRGRQLIQSKVAKQIENQIAEPAYKPRKSKSRDMEDFYGTERTE